MFWPLVLIVLAVFLALAAFIAMVLFEEFGAAVGVMIAGLVCAFLSGGCALWGIHLIFEKVRI